MRSKDNYYLIDFFPVKMFKYDVSKKFKTSRIQNIVESLGVSFFGISTIQIHRFFLPEFVFILKSLPERTVYTKTINDIENSTWLKHTKVKPISRLNNSYIKRDMTVTLQNYQQNFLELYDTQKQKYLLDGYLLGFEQGLGKTITALSLMKSLNKDAVIIIAPKNTLYDVWKNHIDQFYKKNNSYHIVGESDKAKKSNFYIYNYEAIKKTTEIYPLLRNKNIGIIVDESHNFLNMGALRTKNLIALKEDLGVEDTLLLSGTPIKALGTEMIPLLHLLDPMFDDEAEAIFRKSFGVNVLFSAQILKTRLGLVIHRKTKKEVLNLPKKYEHTIKIKIPNGNDYTIDSVKTKIIQYVEERKDYYKKHKQDYISDYEQCIEYLSSKLNDDADFQNYLFIIKYLKMVKYDSRNSEMVKKAKWANEYEKTVLYPMLPNNLKKQFTKSKSVVKYLELKIRGEVLGNLLGSMRAKMTSDMLRYSNLENIINESVKKSVIFTSYVDTVDEAYTYLKGKKYKPVLVYGKTKNVKAELDRFRSNSKNNPLIATIQSLSTGVTLTEANTIIFLNKPWRYTDYSQASDRIHRIGQDVDVNIFTLLLDTGSSANLSTKMEDIMQWSKDIFESLVE